MIVHLILNMIIDVMIDMITINMMIDMIINMIVNIIVDIMNCYDCKYDVDMLMNMRVIHSNYDYVYDSEYYS